jgi:hypothetical protein
MSTNRARSRYGNEQESTLSRLILSDGFDLIKGQAQIRSQIESTSTSTGAVVIYGGQGIMKNLNVGGNVVLGQDGSRTIALNGQITTDVIPDTDSAFNLGSPSQRWNSLQVNEITNTGAIKIFSTNPDPDVGVEINNLQLSGPLTVKGPAMFESDVSIEGITSLRETEVNTNYGDFTVSGGGDFNVISPYFNIQCDRMTLNCTDTVNGVEICTNEPAVPFHFGSAASVCTFNGSLVLIRGDLEVLGTQTIINSQTVEIKDHQIVLGYFDPSESVQASDATANGGGILLNGTTDKSITYVDVTDTSNPDSWVSSENWATAPGKHVQTDILRPRDADVALSICDTEMVVMTVKNGMIGIGTENPKVTVQIVGEDGIQIPVGTTAQRPASNVVEPGMIRYNTELYRYEGYGSTQTWGSLGGVIDNEQTTYITVLEDDNVTDAHKIRFVVNGVEIADFDSSGRLGIKTPTPSVSLDVEGTDAIRIPVGGTQNRPIGSAGMIRYNADLHRYEGYNDFSVWSTLGGVIDLSQTTYITVLSDDGASDVHRIRFFVSGAEVMNLTATNSLGRLGVNTTEPRVSLDVIGTDAVCVAVGNTVERPNQSAGTGMIRYNTDLHRYEGYNDQSVWTSLGGVIDQEQTTYISVLSDDGSTDVHKIRFFVNAVEVADFDENGRLGVGTVSPTVILDIQGTDAVGIAVGSTLERPANTRTGLIRFNTDLHRYEGYTDQAVWASLGGVIDQAQTTYITVESDDGTTDVQMIRFFVQGVEVADFDPTGKLGLGTTSPAVTLDVSATDAIHIPVGTTAERPDQTVVETGMIRYNTNTHQYEGYNDQSVWSSLGGVIDNEQSTYITVLSDDNSTDTHEIRFFVSGVQQAIIGSNGKVGFGANAQPSRVARMNVDGNVVVGSTYCALSYPAPLNGMAIEGPVGIGTPVALSTLDVSGSVGVGSAYAGVLAGPMDGMIVQGSAGFGTSFPMSTVDVAGGVAIGTSFAGTVAAPPNCLIVENQIGIGTATPNCSLDVEATDAIRLPVGSDADRPFDQQLGMVRYNSTTNRFEGLRMIGTSIVGQQQWASISDTSNDDDSTFLTVYDPNTGDSLREIRFYTDAQRVNETVVSGLAMKIDAYGNVGIGGASDRVLGSIFDIQNQQNEQLALRYDDSNFLAVTAGQMGNITFTAYASDSVGYGDINLIPAGPTRKVTIGESTDIFDPSDIPIKLSVYGYVYSSEGLKFADGTIQNSSATQSTGGTTFGQWYIGDLNSSTKKMYQPIDTTQVAIGTDIPTAKLTVAKVNGEADSLNHLELRYSDSAYATMRVDATGTLLITSDLGQQSDILLSPSSYNVGINVQSALASLHVDYDIFAQASSDPDNTSTPLGLYMRYYQSVDKSVSYGLIASGDNQTGVSGPLHIQASQVTIQGNVGIQTTTPASTVGIGGSVAIGATYGSSNLAPTDGLIVQGATGIGTFSPQAGLDVTSPSHNVQIRANQPDATSFGFVVTNSTSSGVVTDGIRLSLDNSGTGYIECSTQGSSKPLVLQSSGGGVSIGGLSANGQMTITQPTSTSTRPVASLCQSNSTAPLLQFSGSSSVGNTARNLVLNDENITAAHIAAFVQVNVVDSGTNVPSTPLYMPLYSLT